MSEVFRSIRDFLFSIMNKQFFVFLFFLFLSAVIWLIMTLNETYEKELEVPVRITNIPKNVVLTSASIDTIHVTVRDKGWLLLSYLLRRAQSRAEHQLQELRQRQRWRHRLRS